MDINADVQDINIDVTVVQPDYALNVSVNSVPNINVTQSTAQPIVVTPPNPNDNMVSTTASPVEIEAINVGGAKGDPGPANELSIGSVTSGETPSAYINGDVPRQVLNLVLPKGDKGDEGDQGVPGLPNVLSIGTVEKGDEASATITGLSPEQILNLVLPKGDNGDPGDTGDPGVAGRSVVSIIKTNTVGLVDTYTITYSNSSTSTFTVTNGATGATGVGIPTGGAINQSLAKASATDYDFTWRDIPATISTVKKETPSGLVNSSNGTFTCAYAYMAGSLEVFINGLNQGSYVNESNPGSGIFIIDAPDTGDNIQVSYQRSGVGAGNCDTVDNYHANATPTANTLLPLGASARFPNSALGRTLLFNGTIARVITLSEAYTNFSQLIIIYRWVDAYGTIVLDTAVNAHNFPVVRQGLIGGAYRIQIGAGNISLSGTTVTGSTTGGTYTNNLLSTSAVSFLDTVGEIQIVRVTGIR